MAIFTILGLVSSSCAAPASLRRIEVDAGMVAAQILIKTNRFNEGTESGDFGQLYPDYSWEYDCTMVETNGLMQFDIKVFHRGNRQPVDTLSILLFSPDSATLRFGGPSSDEGPRTSATRWPACAGLSRPCPRPPFAEAPSPSWRCSSPSPFSPWCCWPSTQVGQRSCAPPNRDSRPPPRCSGCGWSSASWKTPSARPPLSSRTTNTTAFVVQNGENPSLSFVARLSKDFPRSGNFGDFDLRRLIFTVEPGPDSSRQLVMRQIPIMMDLNANSDNALIVDEKNHPVVLAKNVREFKFLLWDPQQNDWVDEWTQTNQLPRGIVVTLRLADTALRRLCPGRNYPHHQPAGLRRPGHLGNAQRYARRDARHARRAGTGRDWRPRHRSSRRDASGHNPRRHSAQPGPREKLRRPAMIRDRAKITSPFMAQEFWPLARRERRAYPGSGSVRSEQRSRRAKGPARKGEVIFARSLRARLKNSGFASAVGGNRDVSGLRLSPPAPRRCQRGIALVIVMISITVLAILAGASPTR